MSIFQFYFILFATIAATSVPFLTRKAKTIPRAARCQADHKSDWNNQPSLKYLLNAVLDAIPLVLKKTKYYYATNFFNAKYRSGQLTFKDDYDRLHQILVSDSYPHIIPTMVPTSIDS